ncbi:MAG: hypothetical protein LBC86_01490 [Oscillospiraceae bacterium]|jgi:hypothetical protein|nr:hypothetical protein [Oscillospiraceae bacterium]
MDKKSERKKKPEREKKPAVPKEPKEQHRVITSLVGNLSHALEHEPIGVVGEISEITEEKEPAEKYHDREKRPTKYRFFVIFGLIVFWLAIMGTLSVVSTVREVVFNITNQTALKEEFELFLFPVVINDPPEFNSAEDNMPASVIISSAIWQIILIGDTSNYEQGFNTILIPENDVEAAVRSIFGWGFDIRHVSAGNIVSPFLYEAETKSYTVPENPPFFTFSPRVAEISSTGDVYRVVVEYIAPSPQFIAGIEYEALPVKTMIFTITRGRDRTKAIQSIELNRENEEFIHF